jgi:hypothetical protein
MARNSVAEAGRPTSAQYPPISGSTSCGLRSCEEVRVRVGADDGDVAAAQLGGQGREHTHLEMTAHEHARPVPVSDGLGPVLRAERGVQWRPALKVVFDELSGETALRLDEAQGVEHGTVSAG